MNRICPERSILHSASCGSFTFTTMFGAVEHFLRGRDDLRAGGGVRRVVDADARTGRALDEHLVTGRNELTHTCRNQADAVLVILDLLRDADAHAQPREGWNDRRLL